MNKTLKDIDGITAAYNNLKHDIQAMIPDEVKEKLNSVTSDIEACRILADNGVDIHVLEKKIKDAGFPAHASTSDLEENALENVSGGFFIGNASTDVVCKCGNRKREDFETLFITGLTAGSYKNYRYVFKCKKCGQIVGVKDTGEIEYINRGNTPLNPRKP